MINEKLAKIFFEIGDFLEMEGVQFKPSAYRRAAMVLKGLEKDVEEIYKSKGIKGLENIEGIGESIAEKIQEYIKTGKIKYYQKLKKAMPVKVEELVQIEGVGPKMVKTLYKKLGVKNLEDLEKAAKRHKIAPLFGFGEKTEKKILQGIEFLKKSQGRFLLGEILPYARELERLLSSLPEVDKVCLAGSIRRRKETIGDIDILATIKSSGKKREDLKKAEKIMDFFTNLPEVVKVWDKGMTKSSVRTNKGFDMDLRLLSKNEFGSALLYFTGSREHNIALRKLALEKGFKLNEYGLFKGKRIVARQSEEEIYRKLGISFIPPELRENQGEIQAGINSFRKQGNGLPNLIELRQIKGDLHVHSEWWKKGRKSIEKIVSRAREMGYNYLGISEHTKFLKIEHGLDEKQLLRQRKDVEKINASLKGTGFYLFQGAETNIMPDGSLDIEDRVLKQLDYVMGGVHSNFKMSKEKMTKRIIKAIKHPYLKVIVHPTGRILKQRKAYQLDFLKVVKAAKTYGVALEINSSPFRLDLNDKNARIAKDYGVKITINTDAHQIDHLRYMELGVSQARRAWIEKKDVINCLSRRAIDSFFKKSKIIS